MPRLEIRHGVLNVHVDVLPFGGFEIRRLRGVLAQRGRLWPVFLSKALQCIRKNIQLNLYPD